mmetsp:Transcript_81242/g.263392  ORF Transcript_81242/g.263392 Transcript_81242/m.263392 type:complete len:220 (-) Transcript_81242:1585-2244(-)
MSRVSRSTLRSNGVECSQASSSNPLVMRTPCATAKASESLCEAGHSRGGRRSGEPAGIIRNNRSAASTKCLMWTSPSSRRTLANLSNSPLSFANSARRTSPPHSASPSKSWQPRTQPAWLGTSSLSVSKLLRKFCRCSSALLASTTGASTGTPSKAESFVASCAAFAPLPWKTCSSKPRLPTASSRSPAGALVPGSAVAATTTKSDQRRLAAFMGRSST